MRVQVLGCSHHNASVAIRERLAFGPDEARCALSELRQAFPELETVLLSTCNRVEFYNATANAIAPSRRHLAEFLARFHRMDSDEVFAHLYGWEGREAVRHLFLVASSLDSMVVGEPQILSQVKQAYQLATQQKAAGPLTHAAFQAALRTARRVAHETAIHQHRVSIASVGVADFAGQIFERFDDKNILVIGAGEMAEETLQYLRDAGAVRITVVNRSLPRAIDLARRCGGTAVEWPRLLEALAAADLVVSTTGADGAIVSLEQFLPIERARGARPLFILDLAVPRDFDPRIAARPEVYLYSIDDLRQACLRNQQARDKELPAAMRIIDQETDRFLAELHHRAVGPVIQRLREGWQGPKDEELQRLYAKLPELDQRARREIEISLGRLMNKLLHPPLESLRLASRHGIPTALLDNLAKLFRLKD